MLMYCFFLVLLRFLQSVRAIYVQVNIWFKAHSIGSTQCRSREQPNLTSVILGIFYDSTGCTWWLQFQTEATPL